MSTGLFSSTGGANRSQALSEYTASIDLVAEPYFNTLSKFSRNARRLQVKDEEGEKKLLEYLPVNERMSLEKEQKVLARWQERQKDWERIESVIGKKVTAKLMGHRINKKATGKPLMMTTTDEYRAKMEEYDLIQAAIPLEDKFAENWQMSLRGGGAIHVAIGHIFSGLECEIDLRTSAPKMVRKPKSLVAVGKNDTFLEQTENLLKKRKKYEKNIETIRPHSLTYRDANNLVAKSVNLFQWAQESSQEYIAAQKELLLSTLMEEEALQEKMQEEERKAQEAIERERLLLTQNKGPKLEYLSPVDVLFETVVGKTVQRSVSFKNIGTTSLYYRWRRLKANKDEKIDDKGKKDVIAEDNSSGNGSVSSVLDAKGKDDPDLLTRVLHQNRDCFFCLRECGEILPEETVETLFLFDSRAGGGIFDGDWLLEIVPDESRIVIACQAQAGDEKSKGGNIKIGRITVHLHGHCIVPDEAMLKRDMIANHLDKHTVYTSVQDIVLDCIRQVRTPLRVSEIERRTIEYFQMINKKLIEIVFPTPKDGNVVRNQLQFIDNKRVYDPTINVYSNNDDLAMMTPLFVTISRIEEFEKLHHRTAAFFDHIYRHYDAVLEEANKLDERLSIDNEFSVDPLKYNHIMNTLFPENSLRCFDEVSMTQIEPRWPFDISTATNTLYKLRPVIAHIEEVENFIIKRNADAEKARLKAERLAAKRASGDSDEEDEEDEEEEPDEGEKSTIVKKHKLLVALNELYGEVVSKIHHLSLHPLSISSVEKLVRGALCDAIDKIDDFQQMALKDAGIQEVFSNYMSIPANANNLAGLIPRVPNPFESHENEVYWANMLALTSPVSEPAVPDKKAAAKPAKNAPPPTTTTPQQCDFYHKVLYQNIRAGILDAMGIVSDTSMLEIKQEVTGKFHSYTEIEDSNNLQPVCYADALSNIATYRKDDLTGAVAFYCMDGKDIVDPSVSAFDIRSLAVKELAEEVVELVKCEVKVVTLLYEGQFGANHSLQPSVEFIQDSIQQAYQVYQAADQKQRKKLKIKEPKEYKKIDVHFFPSFAELYYHLDHLLRFGNEALAGTKEQYFHQYVPILILENIRCPKVYPTEQKFEEIESDDEFPSIQIGKEEYKQRDRRKFIDRRPQRASVTIKVSRGSSTVRQVQEVYCNPIAALQELYALGRNQGDTNVWIDGHTKAFHSYNHAGNQLHAHVDQRLLSHHAREGVLWCSVVHSLSQFTKLAQRSSSLNLDSPINGQETIVNYGDYLSYFFPQAIKDNCIPRSLVVLGGELRIDKLRVLDELITMVDKIFLTGEFALPFITIAASEYIQFYHHEDRCVEYYTTCRALIAKARLVGCSLVWPEDVLLGEDPLKDSERTKCDTNIVADSRSEGADYEGEVKTINISSVINGTTLLKDKVVAGYIYDIGPESTKTLQSAVQAADLIVFWGTVGVCEVNNFQTAQQGLIQTLTVLKPPNPSGGAVSLNNGPTVLLWGEKTVEWFTRLSDSDGEMSGDLVRNGSVVTYMNRDSSLFSGIIGRHPSIPLQQRIGYRNSIQGEWFYTNRRPEEVEAEEDEEEDEDEED